MECSLCGDVGFQAHLFQCRKCLMHFQHQYCSRAYYDNPPLRRIGEVCDWCFTTQEEDIGPDVKLMMRSSVKRMRSSVGIGECTTMTHNSKGKRSTRKMFAGISGKKQRNPELVYSTERRVGKKYKLLDEIVY